MFTPHTLIERLCALIPQSRQHGPARRPSTAELGIFAPAAGLRDRVVPQSVPEERLPDPADPPVQDHAPQPERRQRPNPVPHSPAPPQNANPRYCQRWAELLRRVFLIDVLTCPHCQSRRRLLAAIFDPDSIARILTSLALPTEPPAVAPARPPPQAAFDW